MPRIFIPRHVTTRSMSSFKKWFKIALGPRDIADYQRASQLLFQYDYYKDNNHIHASDDILNDYNSLLLKQDGFDLQANVQELILKQIINF